MKTRGCCKKCKLLKDGQCKDGHEPKQGFNSTVYQCAYRELYAKEKNKLRNDEKKKLESKLEEVFGNYIRYRDKGRCITCPAVIDPSKRTEIHWGHFISRERKSVKFDERNVYAQCAKCNLKQMLNGNNALMMIAIQKKRLMTFEEIEQLEIDSHQTLKITNEWLRDKIAEYEPKLEELRKN